MKNQSQTQDQIKVDGITYNILKTDTPETLDATHPNTANFMRENKVNRKYYLQRPRGKKVYSVVQDINDNFGKVVTLF